MSVVIVAAVVEQPGAPASPDVIWQDQDRVDEEFFAIIDASFPARSEVRRAPRPSPTHRSTASRRLPATSMPHRALLVRVRSPPARPGR